MSDPNNAVSSPIGTPAIACSGDLEVAVHGIVGIEDGKLRVSVNRWAVNEVDDEETSTGWARNRAAHLDNF
jgi:hypothetical protein